MLSLPPDLESNATPDSPADPAARPIAPPPPKTADTTPKAQPAVVPPLVDSSTDVVDAPITENDDEPSAFRPIDPALIYLILLGVTVLGLNPLAPDVRYTALWTILIVVALLAMLFDALEVEIPTAQDMAWGVGYGLLVGVPLLVIALPQLQRTSLTLFDRTSETLAFQSLVLIMPAAESLFFRGAMQPTRGLLFTAIAASIWSMIVFFPQLHVTEFPLVAAVIGFMFVVLNLLYSYVKRRFGLFASWTCQITINVLLLFVIRFIQLS
ncbi:MAG: hypothetical protein ACYDBJ_14130 [Aggregatilineales bacterium]